MGLTIATKDRRFTLKLDDDKSEEMFNNIVTKILTGGGTVPGPVMEQKEPDRKWKKFLPVPEQTEKAEPDPEVGQSEEGADDGTIQETSQPEKPKGYSGFLYLECPHCGKRRAFCSRYPLKYYKCDDCGEETELHDLAQIILNCECGKYAYYLTNVTDEVFDVNCINCGAPVAVQYNAKKKLYETIRER